MHSSRRKRTLTAQILRRSRCCLRSKELGAEFANILWSEGLFRHFDNRMVRGAYAGLAPTPWQSGSIDRKRRSIKGGQLQRLRTTLIQLAWL